MKNSKPVLGTVQFGLRYGIANTHGQSSFRDVCGILKTAVAGGIRTLDTASAYGESENVLGKALRDLNLSGKIDIVSKVSPMPDDLPENKAEAFIRDSLTRSLKNLRQDHLHTLLFHREKDWKYAEILKKIKEEGLIFVISDYIGTDFKPSENHENIEDKIAQIKKSGQ